MRLLYSFLLVNLFDTITSQCADNVPCFAAPKDISKNAGFNLTVTSTCGTPANDFCVGIDCKFSCDANDPTKSHPVSLLIDAYELETYWKSKNFDEPVSIIFDLGSKLILHQITITFQFEFPNGLYIQKSKDEGRTYLTLMYYAIRCNDTFNLQEASFYNNLDVLCFKLNPTVKPGEVQKQLYQVKYS